MKRWGIQSDCVSVHLDHFDNPSDRDVRAVVRQGSRLNPLESNDGDESKAEGHPRFGGGRNPMESPETRPAPLRRDPP
jgi:hypothetical protein